MRLECTPHKPSLLMLSDRFPDPDGNERSARAWRLLCSASVTHRVWLSSISDRPINLALWRQVAKRTDRIHLTAASRWWSRAIPFSGEAQAWTNQQRFDALLATCPGVWPDVFPSHIATAICDFTFNPPIHRQQSSAQRGLFRARRTATDPHKASQVIAACDRALVASTEQVRDLHGAGSKAFVLPDTNANQAWTLLMAGNLTIGQTPPTATILPIHPTTVRQAA